MMNPGIEMETSGNKQQNLEANSIPVSTVALAAGCKFHFALQNMVQSVKIVIANGCIHWTNTTGNSCGEFRVLLMAVIGLSFPAVLHFTHSEVGYGKSEVA
ncbi:Vacuolar cation/proton exchanger 2 [Carex littledalei]|uniref:Vacuolar cation/proton exchanger 2 n=1 Tax=Carex littledalei TaxID=544730 RepID=A0A833RFT8_9POAL|nr:Vacuolar cation/proton exchanger 2 [Carex littledalei]